MKLFNRPTTIIEIFYPPNHFLKPVGFPDQWVLIMIDGFKQQKSGKLSKFKLPVGYTVGYSYFTKLKSNIIEFLMYKHG